MSERCLSCGETSTGMFCPECQENLDDSFRVATAVDLWRLDALTTHDFDPSTPFLLQVFIEEPEPHTCFVTRRGKDLPTFLISYEDFDALPLARETSDSRA